MPSRKGSKRDHPEQPKSAGNTPQKATDPKPCGFDVAPLINKIDGFIATYQGTDQAKGENANKHLFWNRITACATIAAFISASIYAGISYNQWKDARHNSDLEYRPYIVRLTEKDSIHVTVPTTGGKLGPDATIQYHNVGKTIAKNIRTSGCMIVVDGPDPAKRPDFGNILARLYASAVKWPQSVDSDLAPTDTFFTGTNLSDENCAPGGLDYSWTEPIATAFWAGSMNSLLVLVIVRYEGIDGAHETQVCGIFRRIPGAPDSLPGKCPIYNFVN